jgi:hypothetical protein
MHPVGLEAMSCSEPNAPKGDYDYWTLVRDLYAPVKFDAAYNGGQS